MPLDIIYDVPGEEPQSCTTYVGWPQANLTYVHKMAKAHLGPKLRAQLQYFDAHLKERRFDAYLVMWLK